MAKPKRFRASSFEKVSWMPVFTNVSESRRAKRKAKWVFRRLEKISPEQRAEKFSQVAEKFGSKKDFLRKLQRQSIAFRPRFENAVQFSLNELAREFPKVKAVIVTGSYARGKPIPSDIDAIIVAGEEFSLSERLNFMKAFYSILMKKGWDASILDVLPLNGENYSLQSELELLRQSFGERKPHGSLLIPKIMPWHVFFAGEDNAFRQEVLAIVNEVESKGRIERKQKRN